MLHTDTEARVVYRGNQIWRSAHWHRQRQANDKLREQGRRRRHYVAKDGIVIHRYVRDSDCNYHLYDERGYVIVNMVENIRRIGIFMIAAQTVMHFAAGKQYEKYLKIITGVIILLLFIRPFTSLRSSPAVDWQAEIERMEQQMQDSMQQEMPYVVSPVGTVALQKIEEEIKARLNDIVSDQDCNVVDVVIELEETGIDTGADVGTGGRSLAFRHVKVTLEDADAADITEEKGARTIRIDEITVGVESEAGAGQPEAQDMSHDGEIREYQQLFARTLGVTDDKVEVTYHGGW